MDKKDLKKMNLTPIEDLIEEDFGAVRMPEHPLAADSTSFDGRRMTIVSHFAFHIL